MNKKFIFIILSTVTLFSSCTFMRVKNPTTGRCAVNYMMEDQTGQYVKNDSYSYVDEYKIGEFVRVRPLNIDGYTCISEEKDLCGTVPDIYYLGIDVRYRKNYRCVVQNRIYSSFLPNSEFSCYGDTIYIYRTDEALPKILVLDKDNCSYDDPDMSASGSIPMKIKCEGKDYNFNYSYTIASTEEIIKEARELLKTKKFVLISSDSDTDYSFTVKEEAYDFYTNSVVKDLYDNFRLNFLAHTADKDQMERDRKAFAHALVKQYGAFAQEQIVQILTQGINVLNHGILKEQGNFITVGSPNGYASQIKKDISIINGDNRFWIPEGYKASYIASYASHLATDFNDPELLRDLYYGLINDAIKAIANIIIERECYYTIQTKGMLTVDSTPVDEFAYVWKFNSTYYPNLKYVGNTTYDPNECKEYRLQSPFFNLDDKDGYFGADIESTNKSVNKFIKEQVDDMYK